MNGCRPILETIDDPSDLRALPASKLEPLAAEIRELIMEVVAANGGHLASNLGTVELTIALHRVFHSPRDKIVWDVGHQCYAHKILTGRRDAFAGLRTWGGISGFPKRSESPHDIVETGHASTAISTCLGLSVGQERLGSKGKVIAVVGDGALTGGLALSGLNHAGHMRKNLIIVLNDNEMSIGRNVGAISSYLTRLVTTRLYQVFRREFDRRLSGLPVVGVKLMKAVSRLKKGLKAVFFRETLFADLGFEYVGPIDGHDIRSMIKVFGNVRNLGAPVVVHVTTRKGKGYSFAEENPTRYHGVAPFSLLDGKFENVSKTTFSEAFSRAIERIVGEDPRVVAVTAAMVDGTGLRGLKSGRPERVFDVGIAEEHAVTFASGMALAGMRPVVAIYSTFMQRAVDQVIHDVAIPRLPVVFTVDRAGLVGGDGETHQGIFDVGLFGTVPGLTIFCPSCSREVELSLRWALERGGPVMIRYPKAVCGPDLPELAAPIEEGRGVFIRRHNSEVLLMVVGGILPETLKAAHILNMRGISTDVYCARFAKPVDTVHLERIMSPYERVLLVEENVARGGLGELVARVLVERGMRTRFLAACVPEAFLPQGARSDLLRASGLDGESIARRVESLCADPKSGVAAYAARLGGSHQRF